MRKILTLLVLALTLTGCQTTPTQQPAKVLSKNNGYVYLNIINPGYYKGVAVRSLKTGEEYELIKYIEKSIISYGLWLPAGQYTLSKWSGYALKDYAAFTIAIGRVTDLGSLLPVNIGGHELVVLPIRHPEFSSYVNSMTKQFSSELRSLTPLTWSMNTVPTPITLTANSSGLGLIIDLINVYAHEAVKPSINSKLKILKDIPEFLDLALSSTPPNIMEPAKDAENNIYYGANLGQIRVHQSKGGWRSLNTGTLQKVTSVSINNNKIYAGSIDGKLRVSSDHGENWTLLREFKNQAISSIKKVPQGWMIITARHNNYSDIFDTFLNIKSTQLWFSNDDFNVLKKLKQTAISKDSYLPIQLNGVYVNGSYYAHIYPDLVRVNPETLTVTTLKIPSEISYFSVNDNDDFLSITKAQGIFSNLYISTNQGGKWKEINTPPYQAMQVYFSAPKQAAATRWSAGAFSSSIQILKYDASEDLWTLVNEAPDGCKKLLWLDHKPSYCVMRGGSILGLKENKWIVEYTNQ